MTVSAVTKYETVTYIYYIKCKPDLTRRKIKPGIDWDGLEELKLKSWPSSDCFPVESGRLPSMVWRGGLNVRCEQEV